MPQEVQQGAEGEHGGEIAESLPERGRHGNVEAREGEVDLFIGGRPDAERGDDRGNNDRKETECRDRQSDGSAPWRTLP